MASFNGERYIAEQIASILRQLPKNAEFIISDDGSSDQTLSIIKSFNDARIQLLQGPKQGVARNFEFALRHAKGQYIFLADQDDVWLDNKVELMFEALQTYPVAISDAKVVDGDQSTIAESLFKYIGFKRGFWVNWIHNRYLGCTMAFQREFVEQTLPFPQTIPSVHDWWLGLIAEKQNQVKVINKPLMLYRRHGANLSTVGNKSKYNLYSKLSFRVKLLLQLCQRFKSSRELKKHNENTYH